jgi:peptide/nickel transport system substrate-binding protein
MEKSKMWNKVELSIVVLVLIGIIVSSGTMYYTTTVMSKLSTLTSDMSTLTENVLNLTSTVRDLATITGTLAEAMGEFTETLADLEARLAAIEASLAAKAKETLIVGTTDAVENTLDPAQAYDYFGWCIMQQISGTLVSVTPGSISGTDFQPELATSWNASTDGKIWDFTLRQNVRFPDGTELNATHVKYSFDRSIALIPSTPDGAPANLYYDQIINRTEVLSKYKVRFYLNNAYGPMLGIISCRASAIVDPTYAPWMTQVNYTAGDARSSTPLASVGPYYLSRWECTGDKDIEIRLDKNPYYWNATSGYPKTKTIIFRFYRDPSTLRLAVEAGDIDMAFRHISALDVLSLQTNPNVKVWLGPGAPMFFMCFQENHAPFNDSRVRRALAAAINRTAVCTTLFPGLANATYSIIPPGMLGHGDAFKELGDANLTLTTSLLAQLGYTSTNKLKFDLWYESSGHYQLSAEQAALYKAQFEASGVMEVTLKPADWPSYRRNRNDGIMDIFVYGWYPDYFDPDDYAFLYWASWLNLHYDVWSPTAYAQQIALYDQARYTTNETLRIQLYSQIEDIAADQCSIVPLFVTKLWAVTKPKVSGLVLDITQDMRYWLIYIAD